MRVKFFLLYPILCLMFANIARAQRPSSPCSEIGQNPSTAFPICGTQVFHMDTVPYCGGRPVPGPGCMGGNDGGHTDINPYWYKFTCYRPGTLGFKITPRKITDDYDWQLFDVTGHSPEEVFTNKSLYVCMNWSGEGGVTGASSQGTEFDICGGLGQDLFSRMPQLIQGHDYLLLLSHFTAGSQSGYDLEFTGGTADITDPGMPALKLAHYNCINNSVGIRLSKGMLCKTLTAQGTEFTLQNNAARVIGATGVKCSSNFDSDSLLVLLSNPLPPGDYTLSVKDGADNNTLLDYCGNALPAGATISFHIGIPPPVIFTGTIPMGCAPDIIKVPMQVPIRCGTIASDGSDFRLTGVPPGTIIGASGNCNDLGLTDTIFVHLAQPLSVKGDYTITLLPGTDGNTVLGECGQPAAVGQTITFHTVDTVSANFTYDYNRACKVSTFDFMHDGAHDVDYWRWTFDSTDIRNTQNTTKVYGDFGIKRFWLYVSNGTCVDSSYQEFNIEQTLGALFDVDPGPYCPMDMVEPLNKSFGNIMSHVWEYGNGVISTGPVPVPQQYYPTQKEQNYRIRLIVTDNLRCMDTAEHIIMAVTSCYIDVPTAFSPNFDGQNDYLYPLSAYKATDLEFSVYNRLGQLVFHSNNWTNKWNGTVNGKPADIGTYVWMLTYTIKESGKRVFRKGTTVLLR